MDPLRVAIVSPPWYAVPPEGYGGIELLIYLLAQELSKRGHEVTVIGGQGRAEDFELISLAPGSWAEKLGTRDQEPLNCAYLIEAHDIVRRRAFDVVHENNYTGMTIAACMLSCPEREEVRNRTLSNLRHVGWIDHVLVEVDQTTFARRQERSPGRTGTLRGFAQGSSRSSASTNTRKRSPSSSGFGSSTRVRGA